MKSSAGKPCWAWVYVARVNRRQACRHPCHPCRYPCRCGRTVALRARQGVRSVGSRGNIKTLPGGRSHSPGTIVDGRSRALSWHGSGNVSRRERDRCIHSCRDAPLSGGLCVIVVARCSAPRSTQPASGGDSSLRTATRRRRVFKCLCSDVFRLRASAAYRSCSIHCSWRPPALVAQMSPPCCGSHA